MTVLPFGVVVQSVELVGTTTTAGAIPQAVFVSASVRLSADRLIVKFVLELIQPTRAFSPGSERGL